MTLFVLLVLAVVFGQVQSRARSAGLSDPVSASVRALTAPGVRFNDDLDRYFNGLMGAVTGSQRNQAELNRLRKIETAAKLYDQTVNGLERELDQLRKLNDLPNFGRAHVSARIIGYFPFDSRFTLSVGADKGVGVGMPVANGQGLLGIVQTVDARSCQALMISSRAVKFGGMVQRFPEVLGLMKGQTPTRLVLDVLDNGVAEVGDPVVTSGLSSRIPRGIPVGTVAEVVPDPSYGTRRVFVSPSAQIGSSLEVSIFK